MPRPSGKRSRCRTGPAFDRTLLAAGVDETERALIRDVLDSYQYTNALALVVLSALLAHYEPQPADMVKPAGTAPKPSGAKIPELPPMDALDPEVAALVEELNAFRRRHRAAIDRQHVPASRLLAGLSGAGANHAGAAAAGRAAERVDDYRRARSVTRMASFLPSQLKPAAPPDTLKGALASCRLFVEHPIARMTGLCALIRRATPRVTHQPSEHFKSDLSQNALIAAKGTVRRSRAPMSAARPRSGLP